MIVLTTYDTDNEIYRAIKARARGYVLKDARREELLDCIRRVSRVGIRIPPLLLEKPAAGVSSETLTGRELEALTLLARGKCNKEIGVNLYISETTVKARGSDFLTGPAPHPPAWQGGFPAWHYRCSRGVVAV